MEFRLNNLENLKILLGSDYFRITCETSRDEPGHQCPWIGIVDRKSGETVASIFLRQDEAEYLLNQLKKTMKECYKRINWP